MMVAVAQSRIWSAITMSGRGLEEGLDLHGFVWFLSCWSESQGVPARLGARIGEGERLEAWGSRYFNSITKVSTNMSRIKIAGLALASMLVMSMAVTGSASAALLWLVCLKGVGLTKYENSKCLKSKETQTRGEEGWQSLGLLPGQSVTVKILALSIRLIDTKALVANSGAACLSPGSIGEGLIEPGGKGKILVAHYEKPETNCVGVGGCEAGGVKAVVGVNLPWRTEIFEGTEKLPLTKILEGTEKSGKPGWRVECESLLGPQTDTCEAEANKPAEVKLTFGEVTKNPNGVEELLVRGLFQEDANAKADCSQGGKETGLVLGTLAILLPGGALSINKV
jgi:hypothetical protein